jgi:hypothetical protein
VLQDPAKGFTAVVAIFNDKHVYAIEATEVCVRDLMRAPGSGFKVRQRARRMEERGWELGRRRCGCRWPGAVRGYRSSPEEEAFDVDLHLVALDAHTLHYQLVLRDNLLAAVTGLPWPTPDVGNAVVRQEVAILKLGWDVET